MNTVVFPNPTQARGVLPLEQDTPLAQYGAIYEPGEIGYEDVEVIGGGLDIEGVVGNDLVFSLFFDYYPTTDWTFAGTILLDPGRGPLSRTHPLTISVVDASVGLIEVKLTRDQTKKIGPIARRPWDITATDTVAGLLRTILMGKLSLNRY